MCYAYSALAKTLSRRLIDECVIVPITLPIIGVSKTHSPTLGSTSRSLLRDEGGAHASPRDRKWPSQLRGSTQAPLRLREPIHSRRQDTLERPRRSRRECTAIVDEIARGAKMGQIAESIACCRRTPPGCVRRIISDRDNFQ